MGGRAGDGDGHVELGLGKKANVVCGDNRGFCVHNGVFASVFTCACVRHCACALVCMCTCGCVCDCGV